MDSYIREIVTLQIGHYSNFIGSHWLNLQESSFVYDDSSETDLNHDYLFREGKLHNTEQCYTPRLLIIDAKGSLRSLPQAGALYEPPFVNVSTSQALWSGNVSLINQMPEKKNDYLKYLETEDLNYAKNVDLDKDICSVPDEPSSTQNCESKKMVFDLSNSVNVWSDFLGTQLHHKTIYLMDDVCHQDIDPDDSSDGPMLGWSYQEGVEAFKREKTLEDINDRIRLLAESCGSLQGFHLLCDAHDGMGGVGAMVAELIADDYSSKDLFSFLSHPPHYKPTALLEHPSYLTNVIQCYSEISKHSSLLLPLSLRRNVYELNSEVVRWPFVKYKENCPYESSSLLASFLETISVPWRSKSNPLPMSHIASTLTPLQRKVVGGGLSFPIGLEEDKYLDDWFAENQHMEIHNKIGLHSVGGFNKSKLPRISELHTIRGIKTSLLERTNYSKKRMKFVNAWQLLEHYITEEDSHLNRSVLRLISGVRDPLKLGTSFPYIFKNKVNNDGHLKKSFDNALGVVESVPSVANLFQGEEVAVNLRNISFAGKYINVSKLPELLAGNLEKDVWDAATEEFLTLINAYQDNTSYVLTDDSDSG